MTRIQKAIFGFIMFFVAASLAVAQSGGRFHALLEGINEVPSIISSGHGSARMKINFASGEIAYELSYEDMSSVVAQAHIHLGASATNGGVMVFLCQTAGFPDPTGSAPVCPASSGTVTGTISAVNVIGPAGQGVAAGNFDALVEAIMAEVAYVNVHTVNFASGEIRGQLRRGRR